MTKTKNAGKSRPDRTNSANVATKESSSTPAITAHQAECQPCQGNPTDDFNMAIRELAYSKWEAAGFPAGDGSP